MTHPPDEVTVLSWSPLLALLLGSPALANPYAPEPAAAVDEDPFSWEVPPLSLEPGATGVLLLRLVVPAGHTVYRDQLEVEVSEAAGLVPGEVSLPPGRIQPNPADGAELREMYEHDVVVHLPLSASAGTTGLVQVAVRTRHQGCHGGLCYPPREIVHPVFVRVASP